MSASRCQSPCDKDFPLLIRRLFPFLATACLLCPFVLAQKSKTDDLQIIYDTWTFQQGAPENVLCAAQTTDGFLWFGSYAGLFRFDGVRFEHFHAASGDQLLSTGIYSLFAPRSGGLWVGYLFGGFGFLKNGRIRNYGGEIAKSTGSINEFAEDGDGTIWAATSSGVWRFENFKWEHLGDDWNAPTTNMARPGFDRDGVLWVLAGHALLYLLPGTTKFHTAPGDMAVVLGLAQDADGKVLTRPLTESVDGLHSYPILRKGTFPLADRNKGIWLLFSQQLMRVDAGQDIEDAVKKAAPNNSRIFDIPNLAARLVDREGNIWCTDNKAIYRFFYSPFIQQRLPNNATGPFAITAGDDGMVWIGCWHADTCGDPGLFRVANGSLTESEFNAHAGHPDRSPGWALAYRAPDKTFWFGETRGLWHLVHDKFVRVAAPPEMVGQEEYLQAIASDRAGGLWFSFGRHGLYRLADGEWTPFGGRKDLPKTGVVSEFTDAERRVWFGYTNNQLAVLDGDRVQVFGPDAGVRVGNIQAIYGRGGTAIWIAGDHGLQQYDQGKFHSVAAMDGDWLLGISGIVETAEGDLWINGLSGIFHISRTELSKSLEDPFYQVTGEHFGNREALPGVASQIRPIPSAIEGSDGRLWLAFTRGVVSFDPHSSVQKVQSPPITIQSVSADSKEYEAASPLKLPARTSSVRINYSAVSLSDPEAIRFRYKLREADAVWREATTPNPAEYRNLSPGQYHFSVGASDSNGVWSNKIASVDFVILPAWYQTTWFRAFCVCVFLLLLWALYQLRLRQLERQFAIGLEARVNERTRIARDLHDTLLQTLHGLMFRFQAARNMFASRPEEAMQALDGAIKRTEEAIAESRDSIKDLRVERAASTHLGELLTVICQELEVSTPDNANRPTFQVIVAGERRDLSRETEDQVYRIGRELLRNAFQHAHARHIEAEIRYDDDALILLVRDDGKGIDPIVVKEGGRTGHWGLPGVRERAKQIRADIDFWTENRAGTEVRLRIPGSVAYKSAGDKARFKLFRREKVS
jgi:signal transduction histidine kinase/ligand-binding sensor domain-containing protein